MLCKNLCILATTIFTMIGFVASILSQVCYVEDLLSKTSAIRCGAENLVGMTKQRFMDRLTWLKCLMRFNLTNWHDRKNFERVSHTLEMLRLDDSNGSIRKQPYCVLLTGYPGCGKSNYALQIATACLRSRYGSAHPNDIVTLNETDEFQSEFRSSHKAVIFDDLGAEKYYPGATNPWRKVIDFVNNIRKTALNPNVEMKGNVYIEPDLVVITTNLDKAFQTPCFLNAPGAIFRRLKKMIYLERGYEKAKLYALQASSSVNPKAFDGSGWPATVDKCLNRHDLVDVIVREFHQHMEEQEEFVIQTNENFDKVEVKSLWTSFYDDMIFPLLPKKVPLPAYREEQLTYIERFLRLFCVVDSNMPVCMSAPPSTSSNLQVATSIDLVRDTKESGYGTDESTLADSGLPPELRLVSQSGFPGLEPGPVFEHKLLSQSGFNQEARSNLLQEFLIDRVDWKFFQLIRDELRWETDLILFEDRFQGHSVCYSWRYPEMGTFQCKAVGIQCTYDDLERAFERYAANQSQSERDNDSQASSQFSVLWHYQYRASRDTLKVVDNVNTVTWMNEELANLALGKLETKDTMAIVQYVFALRSSGRGFKCLGVEYAICGYTPDVVLRSGNFTIVVECKNTKTTTGKKQLETYLRTLREADIPSLGILFSQRDVNFYSIEPIN